IFEFDNNNSVMAGNVPVVIGVDVDATFAALGTAIGSNCPGVVVTPDPAHNTLTLFAAQDGVRMQVIAGATFGVVNSGGAAAVVTTVTGSSDGSQSLNVPLNMLSTKTIQGLAVYLNDQPGYSASINPFANKFLASAGLDIVTNLNI